MSTEDCPHDIEKGDNLECCLAAPDFSECVVRYNKDDSQCAHFAFFHPDGTFQTTQSIPILPEPHPPQRVTTLVTVEDFAEFVMQHKKGPVDVFVGANVVTANAVTAQLDEWHSARLTLTHTREWYALEARYGGILQSREELGWALRHYLPDTIKSADENAKSLECCLAAISPADLGRTSNVSSLGIVGDYPLDGPTLPSPNWVYKGPIWQELAVDVQVKCCLCAANPKSTTLKFLLVIPKLREAIPFASKALTEKLRELTRPAPDVEVYCGCVRKA